MDQSYLKLLQNRIQKLSELVANSLDIDVTVVDGNLRRIAGTGDFFERIDKSSPKNSIFEKVITNGDPVINRDKLSDPTCLNCPDFSTCFEKKNITYPIFLKDNVIGVVSLACFSEDQLYNLEEREEQYKSTLRNMVTLIENELEGIERNNTIVNHLAEINEVINCIDKGIMIVGPDTKINHINSAALQKLDLNVSDETIIYHRLNDLIDGAMLDIHQNEETLAYWTVKNKLYKVLYKVNRIILESDKNFAIITFDTIVEMIHKVVNFRERNIITFSSIQGRSTALQKSIEQAKVAAASDSTIVLTGESGTGKELFARSIHNESYRYNGPFMAINCACLPESLLESELFGYDRGAFTGAKSGGKEGKFEAGDGGTIFLDEITEIPLHLQAKLLRFLQERQIVRLGSTRTKKIDVRIIASTNKNLEELVANGTFRLDLFYRINILPIYIPPLRDRSEDITLLSEYILEQTSIKLQKTGLSFDDEVKRLFLEYSWPGNIREMENVIEYAVNFCSDGVIGKAHMPEYILKKESKAKIDIDVAIENSGSIKEAIADAERRIICQYMEKYGCSTEKKKKIAEELDISLTTLYRKLHKGEPVR